MNEVVKAENGEDVVSEDVEDIEIKALMFTSEAGLDS